MSIIRRAKRGFLCPRATISKACSRGTPAFSIVASWRVKNVMSFSLTLPPPRKVCRLSFLMRMPCLRKLEVTTVSDAALTSPRTLRLLRSMPSQRYVYSLTRVSLRCAIAVAMVTSGGLLVGDRFNFLERSHALLDLDQAGLAKILHAFFLRLVGNVERVGTAHDQLAHFVGNRHYLVDPDATLVAGAFAGLAAGRPERLP